MRMRKQMAQVNLEIVLEHVLSAHNNEGEQRQDDGDAADCRKSPRLGTRTRGRGGTGWMHGHGKTTAGSFSIRDAGQDGSGRTAVCS